MILSLILPGSSAPSNDYNSYSDLYNVWSYAFSKKKYEEEYGAEQMDPHQANTDYVYLQDFAYENDELPTIVSEQFTTFLKSLTRTNYHIAVKPILTKSIITAMVRCDYYQICDQLSQDNELRILTPVFIEAVKHNLQQILTWVKTPYIDIFLYNQLYLWYDMYWSLDTTKDNPPVITYEKNFNAEYRMCFYNISVDMVLTVHDAMKMLLEVGSAKEEEELLKKIAKPWLDCIDWEYQSSLSILKKDHASWEQQFLYNITVYTRATAMMEYMMNNIHNSYYQFLTPYRIKDMLDYGQSALSFKPLIYSLYLSLFLQPYVDYIRTIQEDINLFEKDTKLANLTLDITAFNESVPLRSQDDKMAMALMRRNLNPIQSTDDNNNTLGELVKFATKNKLMGRNGIHFSLFRTYQAENIDAFGFHLFDHNTLALAEKKREQIQFNLFKKNIDPLKDDDYWGAYTHKTTPITTQHDGYYSILFNHNIDQLRQIAPTVAETKKLLWIVHRSTIAHRPPKFDIQQLNHRCKTFIGRVSAGDNHQLTDYLAKIINLYFELRHLRPYDFYSEEKSSVKLIKFTYHLLNIRYFTYFQAHMIMYLQYIISTLLDPNFRYTPTVATNPVKVKMNFVTSTCEFKFGDKDMASLLINLRTISGGKKLLNRYAGESGIIYKTFIDAMEQKILDNLALQNVYRHYRVKNCIEMVSVPPEKLYSLFHSPYFRIYAFMQDPVIFAKIVDDLLLRMTYPPKYVYPWHYM